MILCFDIGNTDIHGGVFAEDQLLLEFRQSSHNRPSADEFGLFLLQLLQVNALDPATIERVAIASVVPEAQLPVIQACERYLKRTPLLLKAGVKTGLKIRVHNPGEVGADRIANAIAAVDLFPGKDLIVVDMGTATTFCAINREKEYLGGVIAAGLGLSMRALARGTAKLPFVDVTAPVRALGRNTVENIQSGLFFGHLGLIKELRLRFTHECFDGRQPTVIGTGGFARLFADHAVFDHTVPDLVLQGLRRALTLNEETTQSAPL